MTNPDPRGSAGMGAQPRVDHGLSGTSPGAAATPPREGAAGDATPEDRTGSRRATWRAVDEGTSMSVRLIGGILTWAGIGWLADQWLGTGPWLLAVGAVVGNAGGLYLMWVYSGRDGTQTQEGSEGAGD